MELGTYHNSVLNDVLPGGRVGGVGGGSVQRWEVMMIPDVDQSWFGDR